MKNQEHYIWMVEQKNKMLDKTILLAKKLQDARKQIAKPYVIALKKQFPNTDDYEIITTADQDLQKSNPHYKQLTKKLIELQKFNQNPFQGLVKLTKQIQP